MARSFPNNAANYLSPFDLAQLEITGFDITVMAWIKPTAVVGGTAYAFVTKWHGATASLRNWYFDINASSFLELGTRDVSGGTQAAAVGTTVVKPGIWQLAVGRQSVSSIDVFLNGIHNGTSASPKDMDDTATRIVIGRFTNTTVPFNGLIAHVALWDEPLSNQEILELYKGVNPLEIGRSLRAYWPLDDYGPTGDARDASGFNSFAEETGAVPLEPDDIYSVAFPFSTGLLLGATADADTVLVDIQASGTELQEFTEATEVYIDLQASGTEQHDIPGITEDAAEIYIDLQVASTEEYTIHPSDAATIFLDIRVRGIEEGIFWDTFENMDAWTGPDGGYSDSDKHVYISKKHATEGLTSARILYDSVYELYEGGFQLVWEDTVNGDNPAVKYWLSYSFLLEDWQRVWRDNNSPAIFTLPGIFLGGIDDYFDGVFVRALSETTGEIGFFDGSTTIWVALTAGVSHKIQIGYQDDGTDITYEIWHDGAQQIVSDPVWLGTGDLLRTPKGIRIGNDNGNISAVVYLDDMLWSPDVQPRQSYTVETGPGTTHQQYVKIRDKESGPSAFVEIWLDPDQLDTITDAYMYVNLYIPQQLLDFGVEGSNEFSSNLLETNGMLLYIKRVGLSNVWMWNDGINDIAVVEANKWTRIAWHETAGESNYPIRIDDVEYIGEYFASPTGINVVGVYYPGSIPPGSGSSAWIGVADLAFSTTDWVRTGSYDEYWDFQGLDPINDAIATWPAPPSFFGGFGPGDYVLSLEEGHIEASPGLPVPLSSDNEIVLLTLSVESFEIYSTTYDDAVVPLRLFPPFFSGQEVYGSAEEATIYLDMQPGGGECHSTWLATFLGEGEASLEFYTSVQILEWSGAEELEWSFGDVVTEGINC